MGKAAQDPQAMRMEVRSPEELLPFWLPSLTHRDPKANKGDYKKLLIFAGAAGMAGAAWFSGLAAFRCGIGMVKYLGTEENRAILQTLLPEAMYESLGALEERREQLKVALAWPDVMVLGPGLSQKPDALSLMEMLLDCLKAEAAAGTLHPRLLILDADALNLIAAKASLAGFLSGGLSSSGLRIAVTPHVGEMARLAKTPIAAVKSALTGTAVHFAETHGVDVVLKDAATAVAVRTDADVCRLYLHQGGSPALAKAGSGDVLTGIIAGVWALTGGVTDAALPLAVWLHGRAGQMAASRPGVHSTLARDIAEGAGQVLRALGTAETGGRQTEERETQIPPNRQLN